MSSRNATASWSGYAHQGKVSFLVALRSIQQQNFTNLSLLRVELETQEDVKLSNEDVVLEVHQVKAYKDKEYISSYTQALLEFQGCSGSNYLHSICNIVNWASLTTAQNPSSVVRYQYLPNQDFCPLGEIENLILLEIDSILIAREHLQAGNMDWGARCFEAFLSILDEKIRIQHDQNRQEDYNVGFSLEEVLNILLEPPANRRTLLNAIRHKIYNQFVEFINELEDGTIADVSEDHEEFVTSVIRKICLLNDDKLEELLYRIFPATTQGKKISTCLLTDDFFVTNDFLGTFLFTIIGISGQTFNLEDDTYPCYKHDFNYLVTAIQQTEVRAQVTARKILENDRLNSDRYETDYIINEHLSGKVRDKAKRVIDRASSYQAVEGVNQRFMTEKDIEFITRVTATQNLR